MKASINLKSDLEAMGVKPTRFRFNGLRWLVFLSSPELPEGAPSFRTYKGGIVPVRYVLDRWTCRDCGKTGTDSDGMFLVCDVHVCPRCGGNVHSDPEFISPPKTASGESPARQQSSGKESGLEQQSDTGKSGATSLASSADLTENKSGEPRCKVIPRRPDARPTTKTL